MTTPRPRALLAVPGNLATPSGGYGYARRLLAAAPGEGLILRHWPLPGGFPSPDPPALAETQRRFDLLPAGWPVIVDGLAFGALPPAAIRAARTQVIALCHHPLAREHGLSEATAATFRESERRALAEADAVITTSRATGEILAADYGVPETRITVAPPGTDPAPQARGSGGPRVRILSVGSLTPRKGHDVLLAALARLEPLAWELTILGPGETGETAAALLRQAETAGIADRVTLAGPADADALARAYDGADLFALASRYEGFGMAYAEAMARGLPVVGSEIAAVGEATAGAACLVPPGDAAALAAALGPLIREPERRRELAARGRLAAAGFPSWGDTAARVATVVAAVLDGAVR